LPISFTSSNQDVATIDGNVVQIHNAGTTTITASQPGNENYNAASNVDQVLKINDKQTQQITFDPLKNATYGDSPLTLTAASSSALEVTFTSSDEAIASITGSTLTIHKAGTVTITAEQAGNGDFAAAEPVTRTLKINKAGQVITFDDIAQKTFNDDDFELLASASSGLSVSFTSSDESVATITRGNVLSIKGAGTCTITATQSGNDNFEVAASVSRTLVVVNPEKISQSITFAEIPDRQVDAPAFTLDATASSGLRVVYSTESDKIEIDDATVTIVGAGRVTITAAQDGNDEFTKAESVTQSFCINPAKPAITITLSDDQIMLTSDAGSTNEWYRNGELIKDKSATTLSVLQNGSYKVRTQVDGCFSEFSDDKTLLITGNESSVFERSALFPNPAREKFVIRLPDNFTARKYVISSTAGQEVDRVSIDARGYLGVDVSALNSGHYLIVVYGTERLIQLRFVKE
jgi:hypothetical protein